MAPKARPGSQYFLTGDRPLLLCCYRQDETPLNPRIAGGYRFRGRVAKPHALPPKPLLRVYGGQD